MKAKIVIERIGPISTTTKPDEYCLTLTAKGSKEACNRLAKKIFK